MLYIRSMAKKKKIIVQGHELTLLLKRDSEEYISLTDMARGFEGNQVIIFEIGYGTVLQFNTWGYGRKSIILILIWWNSTKLKQNCLITPS